MKLTKKDKYKADRFLFKLGKEQREAEIFQAVKEWWFDENNTGTWEELKEVIKQIKEQKQ